MASPRKAPTPKKSRPRSRSRKPQATTLDFSGLPWRSTPVRGVALCVLRNDEKSRDAAVLIWMDAGAVYPRHRHVGDEEVLVLQGGYRDAEGEYRAGTFLVNPAGSIHTPVALEGPPCILFAVAHRGIEVMR